MQEINISVTLEKAKEWYNSNNAALKEVALQAFSKKELCVFDFTKIKTFQNALTYAYGLNTTEYNTIVQTIVKLDSISRASSAMLMLNIVRKVLNTGYNLHIDKNADDQNGMWYPYFRLIAKDCTYYNSELKNNFFKKIGNVMSENIIYDVISGGAYYGGGIGLGTFLSKHDIGGASAYIGFLGCATEEIAKHFGKYFGMLIMEAMYGDIIDFHIL